MRAPGYILLMALVFTSMNAGIAVAETVYIGDRLVVTLREIPEATAPVIGSLKSDDAMELLEEGDAYFKIRTEAGLEGYIKKQYLTRSLPKTLLIIDLQKQLNQQKKRVAELKSSLASKESSVKQNQGELSDTINQLKKSLAESGRNLESTRKELAAQQQDYATLQKDSGNIISIVTARETLQKENDLLTDELNSLREENAFLLRTAVIKWFLAGAGVLLLGWMIGKSARRKRRY